MTKKLVYVTYSGEIAEAMAQSFGPPVDVLDTRFQPFISNNEELVRADRVTVDVSKWLIDLRFRQKADSGSFYGGRLNTALDVNTYLAVLDHFGFDAEYTMEYTHRMEPMIAEILLHAFCVNDNQDIRARHFHGVTYIRGEFFRQFDDFFTKYGM